MLRNLAFVVLIAIFLHFASDQIKEESAIRIFVCLEHLFKNFLQRKHFLTFLGATFEQRFEKLWTTYWEIK